MPRRGRDKVVMVRGAEKAMEAFTEEISKELGLYDKIQSQGFNGLTTFEAGLLGGTITRFIQAMGEQLIMTRYDEGHDQLIPDELKPNANLMRNQTNAGNRVVDGVIQDTKTEERLEALKDTSQVNTFTRNEVIKPDSSRATDLHQGLQ